MERDDVLMTAPQVRKRYGDRSDMWLWRIFRDETLGFPQPIAINGRRYVSLAALKAWEISQASKQREAAIDRDLASLSPGEITARRSTSDHGA